MTFSKKLLAYRATHAISRHKVGVVINSTIHVLCPIGSSTCIVGEEVKKWEVEHLKSFFTPEKPMPSALVFCYDFISSAFLFTHNSYAMEKRLLVVQWSAIAAEMEYEMPKTMSGNI